MKITHTQIAKFCKLITLDTRSLGIFRIGLGMIVLLDLYIRSKHLEMFYTNDGILPKEPRQWNLGKVSIYLLFENIAWVEYLFIVTAFFAILLALGLLTRIVQPITWFLVMSLQNRNGFVLNDGDTFLILLMFMAMFLPIGDRFSLDRLLFKKRRADNYYSVWTLAYIFQLIIVYAVSGWAKFSRNWHNGLGLYYVMKMYSFAKPPAEWLLQFPLLMKVLTYYTLLLERVGWIILLIHKRSDLFRVLAVFLFAGFHFGLFIFMELGTFPLIGMLAWVPLLPTALWDYLLPSSKGPRNLEAQNSENGIGTLIFKRRKAWSFIIQICGVLAIIINIYNNFQKNDHPFYNIKPVDYVIRKLKLYQGWRVFTGPPTNDGWFVIEATLADSTTVDLFRNEIDLKWERPGLLSAEYESFRLRKYMSRIEKLKSQQGRLVKYKVGKWNETHPPEKQVVRATFWQLEEKTLLDNEYGPAEKKKGYEYTRDE